MALTRSPAYRRYLLALLTVIFAFNFLDRVALGILLPDIKSDLHLSDTQLGLLTGIAFALFYSLMGLPIARLADRGNRVAIVSITAGIWGMLVSACGLAQGFAQLLLIRVGVGVGEAGCVPPAHALIASYFDRDERPRAIAIYQLGIPLAFIVGYFLSGWLDELYGWRVTFVALGSPGIFLGLVAWLTLREPPEHAVPLSDPTASRPIWRDVHYLLGRPAFRQILMCLSVDYFVGYGILQWQPSFYTRSFGLARGEMGMLFALSHGVAGLIGTWLGGEWATRAAAGDERRQLRAITLVLAVTGLLAVGIYSARSVYLAIALGALSSAILNFINGPLFAAIQSLAPPRLRSTATALVFLCANLIGMGLGPLAVGGLSDAMHPLAQAESLRFSLLAMGPVSYFWAAWHANRASRSIGDDLSVADLAQ